MTTIIEAIKTVLTWADKELPLVRWSRAEQSSAPYDLNSYPDGIGTVKTLSLVSDGRGWKNQEFVEANDNFETTFVGTRAVTFSVNIFGNDAFQKAENLRSTVEFEENKAVFASKNLGFVSTSDTRNLTELVSSKYEERAQFDITFYMQTELVKEVDRIVTIKVAGTLKTENTELNEEQEIDI